MNTDLIPADPVRGDALLQAAIEILDDAKPFESVQAAGEAALDLAEKVRLFFLGPMPTMTDPGPGPAVSTTAGALVEDLKRFDPALPVGIPRRMGADLVAVYEGPVVARVARLRGQGPAPTFLHPLWAAPGTDYSAHLEAKGGKLVEVLVLDFCGLPFPAESVCPSDRAVMRATYPTDPAFKE